ncbi:MAG: lipid II flippase MurJ, partial [Pseudomonadota bacterium]|nr:lipid II flippase MurJ [Pseudomonadota bacterium]
QVVNWAVRMSILVSIPTVIGLIILSKPILISLLNYKEFSLYDVDMTSISLIAFSIGLPAMIGVKILITIFYSMKKTSFPAKVAVIAVFFNVTLNLILVVYLSRINFTGVHAGLSIATSFAAYVNFFLLLREAVNQKYIKIEKNTFIFTFKILFASFIMFIVLINFNLDANYWANEKFYVRVINLLSIIFSGIFVFFISLILFKIKKSEIIPNNI